MDAAAALDARDAWEGFSRPVDDAGGGGRWESFLAIQGMYCPACSLAVEDALSRVPGVEGVQVNGAAAIARVLWRPQAGSPSQWIAALARAGYGAIPAGDQLGAAAQVREQRQLLWQWLVAGFCMMQVMMYATPAYIAAPGEMTPDVAGLLRWASLLLTLPVMLFACRPFFASAMRDLRRGGLGMDVAVSLGIAVAFGASVAATFDPAGAVGGEVWYDSLTMFVFFLLSGRLLQQRLADRSALALQGLARSLPESVERDRGDGSFEVVPVRRLRAGDRIRVKPGMVFPADGRIVEGETRVDESMLTGESRPLARARGDAVVAGTHNLGGVLVVDVERAGRETRFAGIVALMARAAVDKPRIALLADRAARPFLAAVLLAAAAAAWWWWPQGEARAIGVAIAVLIVTCPCALSLATPAATLAAAGALARRGVLVRRLEALEAGAAIDALVFDKTGTLTEERVGIASLRVREGFGEAEALALAASLAAHSMHPASRAICAAASAAQAPTLPATLVHEVAGQGMQGHVAGRALRLGRAGFCQAPQQAGDGAAVHLCDDGGWLASFGLGESLRDGASQAVASLRALGMEVALLSGDRPDAVERVAAQAGIAAAHAGQSPEDKLAFVARAQARGRRVAMVGDGMNDGPVLARADLSIAMGEGVPIAQAQSDFIILAGQPDRVPLVLWQARRTRRVIRQNLLWAAAYNAVCVPLALAGMLPPWAAGLGMAASSAFVVLNAARLSVIRGAPQP